MVDLADYQWLTSVAAEDVLAAAAGDMRPLHQRIAALRAEVGPERAALVVELAEQRRRGQGKFGDLAAKLCGTTKQWEQATDMWVAAYKARRFAAAGATRVHDFCCGMGGDLMALAAGAPVVGWDCDAAAALFAERNLLAARDVMGQLPAAWDAIVRCDDVARAAPSGDEAWHVDPDRRAGGVRSIDPAAHAPPPAVIDGWRSACPAGAVKLAPATRPWGEWAEAAQWEWISRDRECRQLVAWFGALQTIAASPASRRATRITPVAGNDFSFESATFSGDPTDAHDVATAPGGYLAEPDPAVIAAELVGALANAEGLATLGAGGVYLTGDAPPRSSLLTTLAVEAVLPLRPADVAKHLAARSVGALEIKVRGVKYDPAAFRKSLKLKGDCTATLVLTRIGRREVAIVAQRA
ncbi:MAG: hypothetical protein KDA44_06055 [Planctomycetales bacterium]|nr:hypothetical protein [Planctomycetales bacterium]